MGQTEPHFLSDTMSDRIKKFSPTLRNIYKKQHGARPCVEKMLLIFVVPPNEELQGTLHPQKLGCTPKNEGKGYPQMKKPVGMLIHLMYGNNYSNPLSYKVTPSVPLL